MPVDTRLVDAARDILTNLAAELTTRGIDVPDRRYIHAGVIAHDFAGDKCAEAFVVAWASSGQGDLGSPDRGGEIPIRCAMPLNHVFNVALLRCVPVLSRSGKPPTEAELDTSGEQILIDAMTLSAAIVDTVLDGSLLSDDAATVAILATQSVGPQGGVGGTVVQLAVSLLGL